MTTNTGSRTYVLTCTDCDYEASVEGSAVGALDVADTHQSEHGDEPTDHFVNCELSTES